MIFETAKIKHGEGGRKRKKRANYI